MIVELLINNQKETVESVSSVIIKAKTDTYSIFKGHQESLMYVEDAQYEIFYNEEIKEFFLKKSFFIINNDNIKIIDY